MQIYYHISLLILTLLLINFRISISKRLGIVDKPDNFRKLHENPTPSIGGLLILINFIISIIFLSTDGDLRFKILLIWCFLTIFFCSLGFLDDRVQLKPLVKTFLILSMLLITLPLDESLKFNNLIFTDIKYIIVLKQSALFFTIFAIFLLFNAINFSDGLNGVLPCQTIFWLIVLIDIDGQNFFLISLLICLIIIFLFNVNGKLFLGNSGSSIISIILSLYFIKIYNENLIKFDEIVLIFFLVIIDTIRIIIERVINNQSPFSGDNNHFHHLLAKVFKKQLVFIPYLFLTITPYITFMIFKIETYYILFLNIVVYFLLLLFLKKIQND